MIDSTNLTSNATHTIVVSFVNAAGAPVVTSTPLTILVDNNPCVAVLGAPSIGSAVANSCGLLVYAAPANIVPGIPAASAGGLVPAASPIKEPASALLGPCAPAPGIAAFAESLHVSASATNGWSRQSQYDASATQAFVLVPA